MNNSTKKIIVATIVVVLGIQSYAQDLSSILESKTPETKNYTTSTFKGTRILNGHSIENRKKGTLEFVISHRFGRVNTGASELFGLDQSNIRFAFEYALIDELTLGVGRSSFDRAFDGFFKYKVLKQTQDNLMPVTVSLFGSTAYDSFDPTDELSFSEKLSYVSQILIARKFSPSFSFQVTPTYVHLNSVAIDSDPHDIFALGLGARIKLSNRVAISGEYFLTSDQLESIDTQNSIALGVEIETGGHVFQIILSNAITMIENSFITQTQDNFFEGDIHLGFNISRAFQLGKHHTKK